MARARPVGWRRRPGSLLAVGPDAGRRLLLAPPPRRADLELRPRRRSWASAARDGAPSRAAFERAPPPPRWSWPWASTTGWPPQPDRQTVRVSRRPAPRPTCALTPLRRGEGRIEGVWARWRGPLGLVWLQRTSAPGRTVAVTPDVAGGEGAGAAPVLPRRRRSGVKPQLETRRGRRLPRPEGFQTGMDLRDIDWKQSRPPRQAARPRNTAPSATTTSSSRSTPAG